MSGPKPSSTVTARRLQVLKYLADCPREGVTLSATYANAVAMWQTQMVWSGWRGSRRVYGITPAGRTYLDEIPKDWYCHSCGRSHTHTVAQRDAHRDELRAAQAALIDRGAR